jgi:phage terminase small subunit
MGKAGQTGLALWKCTRPSRFRQPFYKVQGIFVKEYLTDGNATRAAKAAGYSEKTVDVQGSRLLANVKVRAEIDRQTEKRCEKLDITADYVLRGFGTW